LLEVHQDEASFPVVLRASSDLLDIAVLDSGKARESALSLRKDHQIVLGESITSVGFPLHGLLGDSPNVTRGNISASKGIRGSLGQFQFSAPIQPGNSGGPIVSDNGELLGMAVSTLDAGSLAKRDLIPQNVNFALDARYGAMFLKRENVAFDVIQPTGPGSMQTANQAALSNTVQLNCYQ
jgi:S1-C subfamily serine protease